MPVMFFGLALALATIGAGNIAAAALVGPMAMAVAGRAGIPAFLMTIMVAHGAVAGALSPFAPTGIIADGLMGRMGLSGLRVADLRCPTCSRTCSSPSPATSPSAAGGCSAGATRSPPTCRDAVEVDPGASDGGTGSPWP